MENKKYDPIFGVAQVVVHHHNKTTSNFTPLFCTKLYHTRFASFHAFARTCLEQLSFEPGQIRVFVADGFQWLELDRNYPFLVNLGSTLVGVQHINIASKRKTFHQFLVITSI